MERAGSSSWRRAQKVWNVFAYETQLGSNRLVFSREHPWRKDLYLARPADTISIRPFDDKHPDMENASGLGFAQSMMGLLLYFPRRGEHPALLILIPGELQI